MEGDQDVDAPQEIEPMIDTDEHGTWCEQPPTPQKAEANFLEFHQLDPRDVDAVAREIGGLFDAEEGAEDLGSEAGDDFWGGDDDSEVSDDADDDASCDSEDLPTDSEVEETMDEASTAGGPNSWIRDQYKAFARAQVGNTLPFGKAEEASIELMNVMKLKKSPLNAYKDIMEWHLKDKGDIGWYEGIKHSQSYISREVMLKKLRDRYNFKNKYPYKKKIKLPVCGQVIHQ